MYILLYFFYNHRKWYNMLIKKPGGKLFKLTERKVSVKVLLTLEILCIIMLDVVFSGFLAPGR